ncbi:hypothetical protein EV188_104690 [Actinomycetospora succinea]|uniref:ANTAR domain-containing protein n=1 Tax=Actinomycetospora succinea TaxID=663603 RepID=A0A4R6VEB2_9PSEU|nr:ANTAR domain-containing protein [Actinomycetospora succinea]TDQ58941.1 hypothetical protein EV188_104690 [Actinomycetospora succinea]
MSAQDGAEDALRRHRLLALVDGEGSAGAAAGGGRGTADAPALLSRLGRVCTVAVSEVRVDGAGVTVMGSLEAGVGGARDQIAATGRLTQQLEDLQLTTGEGPCLDAYRGGLPVLAGDIAAEPARWLGFGPEAVRAGVAALFSLPLQVGAVRLGTLDLHRLTTGPLTREQLADALALAALATEALLDLTDSGNGAAQEDDGDVQDAAASLTGWLPDVHADVHIAAGMVSARAGVDVATALLRVRAHAFSHSEPIHDVARRIIARDLVLDRSGTPEPGPPPEDGHEPSPETPAPDPEGEDP